MYVMIAPLTCSHLRRQTFILLMKICRIVVNVIIVVKPVSIHFNHPVRHATKIDN